jgi:glycosyltransferase involved in cell wall biosynthesis
MHLPSSLPGHATNETARAETRQQPLRTAFLLTSMPVGGAEKLLESLLRGFLPERIDPEILCLKEPGPLGLELSRDYPVFSGFLNSKWDLRVLGRLTRHLRQRRVQAVVTVGAGDKMFWGRLAAKLAGVKVICSALHSTGWPDGVGRLNRLLTPITDGFIAVARDHAQFLVNWERFPRRKVFMIPNGVDTQRFRPDPERRAALREELGVPHNAALVGIVAALRPEKNHLQFVHAAREVLRIFPECHFVIVGDGPQRAMIEAEIQLLGLAQHFHLLGTRSDTPAILAGLDVFALTSRNEANPVSILEALASGVPVVSPQVGSVGETVLDEITGLLTEPGNAEQTAVAISRLLAAPHWARTLGRQGRAHVCQSWSQENMIGAYEQLLTGLYAKKTGAAPLRRPCAADIPTGHQALHPTPMTASASAPMKAPQFGVPDAGWGDSPGPIPLAPHPSTAP